MNESQFKYKVVKFLKRPGCWIYCPSDKFRRGVPDILVLEKGRLYAIELKIGDRQTTALQRRTMAELHKAGASVIYMRRSNDGEITYYVEASFWIPDGSLFSSIKSLAERNKNKTRRNRNGLSA